MIYEQELTDKIIGAAMKVYNELSNGFLEKVYENALLIELRLLGIKAENQVKLEVFYGQHVVGEYFADIIVEDKIILELKVCKNITEIHEAQLMNYLKATKMKIGYVINFGTFRKIEFRRRVL